MSVLAPQKRVRFPEPLKMFRKDTLERHNEKRTAHCVTNLTLNANLNKISQDLADKLAAADITPPVYEATGMQTVYFNKGDDDLLGKQRRSFIYFYLEICFHSKAHVLLTAFTMNRSITIGKLQTSD